MHRGAEPGPRTPRSVGGNTLNGLVLGAMLLVFVVAFLMPESWGPAGTIGLLGGFFGLVFIALCWFLVRMRLAAKAERELFQTGRRATAVVEGVERTGVLLNDNPQIVLRLRVRPPGDAEFPHVRRMFVPIHAFPRPGDMIEVAFDPADPTRVALATDWDSHSGGGQTLMLRRGGAADGAGGASGGPNERMVQQLERLDRLRQSGSITFAEFEEMKARILSGRDG